MIATETKCTKSNITKALHIATMTKNIRLEKYYKTISKSPKSCCICNMAIKQNSVIRELVISTDLYTKTFSVPSCWNFKACRERLYAFEFQIAVKD